MIGYKGVVARRIRQLEDRLQESNEREVDMIAEQQHMIDLVCLVGRMGAVEKIGLDAIAVGDKAGAMLAATIVSELMKVLMRHSKKYLEIYYKADMAAAKAARAQHGSDASIEDAMNEFHKLQGLVGGADA